MSFAPTTTGARAIGRPTAAISTLVLVGAAGLVATAAIHLAEAPGTMEDGVYLGVAFAIQAVAALVAAVMAVRGSKLGLLAGIAIAGTSLAAYTISRTVGLPGQANETWLEPTGVVAIVSEAITVLAFGLALLRGEPAAA